MQLGNLLPPGAKWVAQEGGHMQLHVPEYSTPRSLHIGELSPDMSKELSYVVQLDSEYTGIQWGYLTAFYTYELNELKRSGESRSNEYSILIEDRDE